MATTTNSTSSEPTTTNCAVSRLTSSRGLGCPPTSRAPSSSVVSPDGGLAPSSSAMPPILHRRDERRAARHQHRADREQRADLPEPQEQRRDQGGHDHAHVLGPAGDDVWPR